jgi:hypothetical protein
MRRARRRPSPMRQVRSSGFRIASRRASRPCRLEPWTFPAAPTQLLTLSAGHLADRFLDLASGRAGDSLGVLIGHRTTPPFGLVKVDDDRVGDGRRGARMAPIAGPAVASEFGRSWVGLLQPWECYPAVRRRHGRSVIRAGSRPPAGARLHSPGTGGCVRWPSSPSPTASSGWRQPVRRALKGRRPPPRTGRP